MLLPSNFEGVSEPLRPSSVTAYASIARARDTPSVRLLVGNLSYSSVGLDDQTSAPMSTRVPTMWRVLDNRPRVCIVDQKCML